MPWHWDGWSVHLSQEKAGSKKVKGVRDVWGVLEVRKRGFLWSWSKRRCIWEESEQLE